MSVRGFALSLFLNAAQYDLPAAYLSAYQASVNGTAFLQLTRAELASALALSETEADAAMSWRFNMTSGCTCVSTEPWIWHGDY